MQSILRPGQVIVRLYEAHGGRAEATLHTALGFAHAERVAFLEDAIDDPATQATVQARPRVWPE